MPKTLLKGKEYAGVDPTGFFSLTKSKLRLKLESLLFRESRYRLHAWSNGTYIDANCQLNGFRSIQLGRRVTISDGVWMNVNFPSNEPVIIVGDGSFVGRDNFFSAGSKIQLGDFFFSGLDCRFLGAGHDIQDPYLPYLRSGLTNLGPIRIGANCWLATAVTVIGPVQIGHGSVIGAGSLVTSNIPPFSLAFGNPARLIKRYSHQENRWIPFDQFGADQESALPEEDEYIAKLRKYGYRLGPIRAASSKYGWV